MKRRGYLTDLVLRKMETGIQKGPATGFDEGSAKSGIFLALPVAPFAVFLLTLSNLTPSLFTLFSVGHSLISPLNFLSRHPPWNPLHFLLLSLLLSASATTKSFYCFLSFLPRNSRR